MNKAEIIEQLATGPFTKADAERFLNRFTNLVTASVRKGDEVKIVGFGTFIKAKRKARMGRNPQTGVAIKIPAAWGVKFRPGQAFKDAVK